MLVQKIQSKASREKVLSKKRIRIQISGTSMDIQLKTLNVESLKLKLFRQS